MYLDIDKNYQSIKSSFDDFDSEHKEDESVVTIEKVKIKRPPLYKVILHNDDYTTMEFVIVVLQKIFHKTSIEAENLMLKIHNDGAAICGIYTYEIAETKRIKVEQYAKDHAHPLVCSTEAEL